MSLYVFVHGECAEALACVGGWRMRNSIVPTSSDNVEHYDVKLKHDPEIHPLASALVTRCYDRHRAPLLSSCAVRRVFECLCEIVRTHAYMHAVCVCIHLLYDVSKSFADDIESAAKIVEAADIAGIVDTTDIADNDGVRIRRGMNESDTPHLQGDFRHMNIVEQQEQL